MWDLPNVQPRLVRLWFWLKLKLSVKYDIGVWNTDIQVDSLCNEVWCQNNSTVFIMGGVISLQGGEREWIRSLMKSLALVYLCTTSLLSPYCAQDMATKTSTLQQLRVVKCHGYCGCVLVGVWPSGYILSGCVLVLKFCWGKSPINRHAMTGPEISDSIAVSVFVICDKQGGRN